VKSTTNKQDIVELGADLASDVTGRRSLLYPVLPTSTKHYIPSTLSSLAASAETAREAGTSKKDPATRRKELLEYASPGLLSMIAEKGEEMVRDPGSGLVVQEVMLMTVGGKSSEWRDRKVLIKRQIQGDRDTRQATRRSIWYRRRRGRFHSHS
jgi:pumilio family protein 6